MHIAIASGKGGTGKTTIATSLALSLIDQGKVYYVDCDVEAPNGHLFLKPDLNQQTQAIINIPQIQVDHCTLCGKCVEVCQFHALAKVGKTIMVFPQLCHGCGSCTCNCPEGAINEVPNQIGMLESGLTRDGIYFSHGQLTISEPMPTPVIRQLKRLNRVSDDSIVIFDAPPGASCSVVETLRGADFVILVTEPTPFGLHDLKQMLGIIKEMGIPTGIIINRDGIGDSQMDKFLTQNHLSILLRIPFDKLLATSLAAGHNLIDVYPEYRQHFRNYIPTNYRLYKWRQIILNTSSKANQLIILSGKGGTGKTSFSAAFAHLSCNSEQSVKAVFVDADVDAANLSLVLQPVQLTSHEFWGGSLAKINSNQCTGCGFCVSACRYDAVLKDTIRSATFWVDPIACDGCAACVYACPNSAISMVQQQEGHWFQSDTPYGMLFHAELFPGKENSGKLVTIVKQQARLYASDSNSTLVILDGPPGIGCPVISACAGTDLGLIVTEPSVAGLHDLKRIVGTLQHFHVPSVICINKADIYPQGIRQIREYAIEQGIDVIGEIPFDEHVPQSMVHGSPITEVFPKSPAAQSIRKIWEMILERFFN